MGKIKGKLIHDRIKKKMALKNDSELAKFFSVKPQQISTYNKKEFSANIIANYIKKAYEKGVRDQREKMQDNAINCILEYAPIERCPKTDGFTNPPGTQEDYRKMLKNKKGIYVFYGSMFTPIYIGKTVKQDLWSEMKVAYNKKEIKSHHRICREGRTIIKDVAHYISAYEVDENIISAVEAIMIRSFINIIDNVKAERLPNIK